MNEHQQAVKAAAWLRKKTGHHVQTFIPYPDDKGWFYNNGFGQWWHNHKELIDEAKRLGWSGEDEQQ